MPVLALPGPLAAPAPVAVEMAPAWQGRLAAAVGPAVRRPDPGCTPLLQVAPRVHGRAVDADHGTLRPVHESPVVDGDA